ncbi:MAG: FecCD family ABC transporter permease [Phycisphaerales bacterium]
MRARDGITLGVLTAALLAAGLARLYGVGPWLDPSASDEARAQMVSLRAVRVGAGASVGACLAVAGVMLQSLMRNPLASPDLMGMSAGAGLAVLIARAAPAWLGAGAAGWVGVGGGLGTTWEAAPALVGAMATLGVVFVLSQRRGLVDPTWLVLIGVMISILCGAGIMLVQHLAPGVSGGGSVRVLVGALSDEATGVQVMIAGGVALGGIGAGIGLGPAMDAASLHSEEAMSVGVPMRRLRVVLLLVSGVLTAAAVTVAGPLGFVGLVCPHVVRMMSPRVGRRSGRDSGEAEPGRAGTFAGLGWWGVHRVRIIGSALAGAALVVGGDAIVSAIRDASPSTGRVPLGVVMAFVGAPAFVLLLRRGPLGMRG